MPDHYTCLIDGQHTADNIGYLIYGPGVEKDHSQKYTEKEIQEKGSPFIKSYKFLSQFFDRETHV